ncbi:hypothetical protein GCM10011506_22780 [Marivirga lumbricoides]|uniref:Riboflavin synthase subunit beta n=1 Tax=Marivirga lumbricoides TaxID=1046115 RepID=A0ABQ1M9B9_9BACT|nr:hypothetical protein GCM10011506_22780 [Marivirga lumbricoides]
MTGGLGFTRAAKDSYDSNRALRNKKSPFQTAKNNQFIKAPKLKFKEASKEEIDAFKHSFLKKKKRSDRIALIGFVVFTSFFLFLIWYWLFS